MEYDIKDIELAERGELKMEWAERTMPVLARIKTRFAKEKPLRGMKIAACLQARRGTS
jgi:adenosylhomocysteinase